MKDPVWKDAWKIGVCSIGYVVLLCLVAYLTFVILRAFDDAAYKTHTAEPTQLTREQLLHSIKCKWERGGYGVSLVDDDGMVLAHLFTGLDPSYVEVHTWKPAEQTRQFISREAALTYLSRKFYSECK